MRDKVAYGSGLVIYLMNNIYMNICIIYIYTSLLEISGVDIS